MGRTQASTTTVRDALEYLGLLVALAWLGRGALIHFTSIALGGSSEWATTFAAGVWSMLPYLFRDLLLGAFVMINGQIIEHSGLGVLVASGDFVADSANLFYVLLSNIDPFAVWHLILLTVGIRIATDLPKARAAILSILTWLVILALKLVPGLLSQLVTGRLAG